MVKTITLNNDSYVSEKTRIAHQIHADLWRLHNQLQAVWQEENRGAVHKFILQRLGHIKAEQSKLRDMMHEEEKRRILSEKGN